MKKNILFFLIFLFCLNLLVFAESKPKIAFIILEENIDKRSTNITETRLKIIFQDKGFNVVESVFKEIQIDEDLIDDYKKIESLIKNLNAEMVVIGKAVVEEIESEANNPISYSASISATVFATENIKVLGSSKVQAVSYNDDAVAGGLEALEKASSELAENLVNQILQKRALILKQEKL